MIMTDQRRVSPQNTVMEFIHESDVLQARQETIMTVVAYKCVYIMGDIQV